MLPEPIRKRLERLDEILERLEEIKSFSLEEFLKDWKLQDIALRNLQVAVECCLDIGTYLLSQNKKEIPDTYVGIIEKLEETSVIDKDISLPLKELVKLRNIIVHEYLSINYQKVYEHLQNTTIFKKYAQAILHFLEKSK